MIYWMLRKHPWTFVLFLLLYVTVAAGSISLLATNTLIASEPLDSNTMPLKEWLEFLKEYWPMVAGT